MKKLINREPNYPVIEKLFFIAWALYLIQSVLGRSTLRDVFERVNVVYSVLFYATFILLLLCFAFVGRIPRRRFILFAAFSILTLLIQAQNVYGPFVVMVLFIMAAQYIDLKKLLRCDIALKLALIAVVFVLYGTGVIPGVERLSDFSIGAAKYGLGFKDPNWATCLVMTILLEWMSLRFHKITMKEWIILPVAAVATLYVMGGRTTVYTFLVVYVLFVAAKRFPEIFYSRLSKAAFVVITPALAVFSFVAGKLYEHGNSLMILLNRVLSNRLKWIVQFLDEYEINLFGQKVELGFFIGQPLDNAYVRHTLVYGLIFEVAFCVMSSVIFWKLLKDRKIEWALLSLFFILVGFGEHYVLTVFFNLTLLYILGTDNIDPPWKTAGQTPAETTD